MLRNLLGGAIVAAGLCAALPGPTAAAADFHQIFEARCTACHGHAGDFARTKLAIDADGTVRGAKSGREVAPFLRRHGGGLSEEEIEAIEEQYWRGETLGPDDDEP